MKIRCDKKSRDFGIHLTEKRNKVRNIIKLKKNTSFSFSVANFSKFIRYTFDRINLFTEWMHIQDVCIDFYLFNLLLFLAFVRLNLHNSVETEWLECVSSSLVEFAHKFNPGIRNFMALNVLSHWQMVLATKWSMCLTYQCKRSVCRKADRPSIITRMAKVPAAQQAKNMNILTAPT